MERDVLSQIKSAIDLRGVIGRSIELKPQGRWYMGLCPFHNDTKPSLGVTEDFFCCFGCGIRGDVFTWLQQYRSLSFPDAVKEAAELAGIKLGPNWEKAAKAIAEAKNQLKEYVERSQEALWSPDGAEALAYLQEQRHLDDETIQQFGLGYDAKQKAIVIPLFDISGSLAAYALRLLNGSKRYLIRNRPGFKRSHFLYNMHVALQGDGPVYVCEGYFDVMSVTQAGFPRVVGLCGAQPTEWQLDWLIRTSDHVVLVSDVKSEDDLLLTYQNVQKLRSKTGAVKVEVVLPPGPDANESPQDKLAAALAVPKEPELALIDVLLNQEHKAHQYVLARKLYLQIDNPLAREDFIEALSAKWGKSVDLVRQALSSGRRTQGSFRIVSTEELVAELEEYYTRIVEGLQPNLKWPGFPHDMLCHLHTGHLIAIAARTNVGKTNFALNLIPWTASDSYSQLYVSLEQPVPEIMDRISRITLGHAFPGVDVNSYFSDIVYELKRARALHEAQQLEKAFVAPGVRFLDLNLLVDCIYQNVYVADGGRTLGQLKELIAQTAEQADKPIKVVWIDFLGMMRTKASTEYERLTKLVLGLSYLAKELDILIIFLHQLSRKGGTGSQNVEIDMLRGSGQIEELVDLLLGLHRPQLQDDIENPKPEENFVVDVIKNRHGPKGRINLTMYKTSLLITKQDADGRPNVLHDKLQGILRAIREDTASAEAEAWGA